LAIARKPGRNTLLEGVMVLNLSARRSLPPGRFTYNRYSGSF